MSRTPHSRTRPPAPKERSTDLSPAGGHLVRPLGPPLNPRPESPETRGLHRGDTLGALVFFFLIVLGLIAAARAFLVM